MVTASPSSPPALPSMPPATPPIFAQHAARMSRMKTHLPDAARAFGSMFTGIMKDNAQAGGLSSRDKELIALAIGVAQHCEPCILSHVQKSISLGATRQQVLDAASVAVVMAGGPAYVHLPVVIEALDALPGAQPSQ